MRRFVQGVHAVGAHQDGTGQLARALAARPPGRVFTPPQRQALPAEMGAEGSELGEDGRNRLKTCARGPSMAQSRRRECKSRQSASRMSPAHLQGSLRHRDMCASYMSLRCAETGA